MNQTSIQKNNKNKKEPICSIASTKIQSLWRGHQVRKKFVIESLKTTSLKDYKMFLVGNDPKIHGLSSYTSSGEKIAFVGTSGFKSIALALALGGLVRVPKLIIVDNSIQVITFWRNLRKMLDNTTFSSTNDFIQKFQFFLKENKNLYHNFPDNACTEYGSARFQYENQNPIIFLSDLIDKYGMVRVVDVIKQSSIIQQSWVCPELFVVLKNFCRFNGIARIIAYPSNIAHCIVASERESFFKSLEALEPSLSILTDLCSYHLIPERVFLTEEKKADAIKGEVFQTAL